MRGEDSLGDATEKMLNISSFKLHAPYLNSKKHFTVGKL